MIEISHDKLKSIIERLNAIIGVKDEEIKNCALIAIVEEFEDLKNKIGYSE